MEVLLSANLLWKSPKCGRELFFSPQSQNCSIWIQIKRWPEGSGSKYSRIRAPTEKKVYLDLKAGVAADKLPHGASLNIRALLQVQGLQANQQLRDPLKKIPAQPSQEKLGGGDPGQHWTRLDSIWLRMPANEIIKQWFLLLYFIYYITGTISLKASSGHDKKLLRLHCLIKIP